ncbi:hypothetical protein ABH935_009258 [Catenulispora sp. GAS73]|uniref:hypothetical protein n=1 Tax=Catenulispora sp. GAS73 TaxID=3156269 RepID=UPI0035159540
MRPLTLSTRISRVASGGREFRVIRAERLSRHLYVHAGRSYYEILADLGAGLDFAAAWALAMRSPRSLVYLPVRSNRPPQADPWRERPLDVVFVHASMQFRVSAWTRDRDFPHHLRYATAAETLFVVGSGPAFEREGAWVRHFVEELPAADRDAAGTGRYQCVEIWPSRWKPGRTRRIGPTGLHLTYTPNGWPSGR